MFSLFPPHEWPPFQELRDVAAFVLFQSPCWGSEEDQLSRREKSPRSPRHFHECQHLWADGKLCAKKFANARPRCCWWSSGDYLNPCPDQPLQVLLGHPHESRGASGLDGSSDSQHHRRAGLQHLAIQKLDCQQGRGKSQKIVASNYLKRYIFPF